MRVRRDSRISHNPQSARQAQTSIDAVPSYAYPPGSPYRSKERRHRQPRQDHAHISSESDDEENGAQTSDRTPLLSLMHHDAGAHRPTSGYGIFTGQGKGGQIGSPIRRRSTNTSASSKGRRRLPSYQPSTSSPYPSHNVNNPPSVPNSPKLGPRGAYGDVMVTGSYESRSQEDRRTAVPPLRDQIIDIDVDGKLQIPHTSPSTSRKDVTERRRIAALPAEEDVCFPLDGLSQLAEDEYAPQCQDTGFQNPQRRRRYRQWPDLVVLDEWSREEKEVRSEGIRAKKISEPVLVGGRLRPQKLGWHRAEEDAPYRFTYFNEEIPSTIHSQTISELLQPGQNFRDLFIPDLPELSDQSSDGEVTSPRDSHQDRNGLSPNNQSQTGTRHSSILGEATTMSPKHQTTDTSEELTPSGVQQKENLKKFGTRPTFWLDVLSPTDTEMRVISKTFGIHPLTAEDIMMQEAREKVELFRNYYLVNYRTFEQDMNSENFLEPVNMYVVVFREGVISFHFSMIPHPANVRRRIRQLKDYLMISSDWISYAIIDDITDAFAPLIQSIEDEVDEIDDAILQLHSGNKEETAGEKCKSSKSSDQRSEAGEGNPNDSGSDMLRRVGEGRKKVMGLYRLLGNKADVIKGFAKRCNEQWDIAPRSEIGLYLGDIQDHILTMTSNLSHYET
jgi:magnesium transporter